LQIIIIIMVIIIMDAQTRFSSSELKARRSLPTYTLTCYKLYNKHTHIYKTRTRKQTRGIKAGRFATRKEGFAVLKNKEIRKTEEK